MFRLMVAPGAPVSTVTSTLAFGVWADAARLIANATKTPPANAFIPALPDFLLITQTNIQAAPRKTRRPRPAPGVPIRAQVRLDISLFQCQFAPSGSVMSS